METQSAQSDSSSLANIEESLALLCRSSDSELANPSEKTILAAELLECESLIRSRRPRDEWNAIARRFLSSVPSANATDAGGVFSVFARLHRARPAGANVVSVTSWSGFEVYTRLLSVLSNLSDASDEFCSRATADGTIGELFVKALDEPRTRGVDATEDDARSCGCCCNREQRARALSQQHEALILSYIGGLLNLVQRHPPSRAVLQRLNALSTLRFYLVAPVYATRLALYR